MLAVGNQSSEVRALTALPGFRKFGFGGKNNLGDVIVSADESLATSSSQIYIGLVLKTLRT
jgi:hypothetical protein